LVGNYDIAAWGLNDSSGGGSGGGGCDCIIIDNLLSDSSTSCLSANQGRILKEMIDNIEISGSGDGHVHVNLDVLNSITQTDLDHWDLAYDKAHDHENKALLDSLTAS
jgi:hypothetical protein